MATTEFTATEDPVDNPTLLDAYNAQPKAGISYEVTPEFKAELQAARTHQDWLNTPVEPTDYSTLSGKQNRTIRDSISFIVGEDLDLYSKPAVTKKDYYERGFLDQEGKVTPKGVLAGDLIEKGILNKDFTLTEEGNFFNMKESDFFTQGNLDQGSELNLKWSNVPQKGTPEYDLMIKWQRAKDLGLYDEDEVDKPFVDTVIETGKGFGEFLYNSLNTIRSAGALAFDSPLQDIGLNKDQKKELEQKRLEDKTRVYGKTEGFVENAGYSFSRQTAFVNQGTNKLARELGIITPEQEIDSNTHNYYKAASIKNFQDKTNTVAGITEAVGVNAIADLLIDSAEKLGTERSKEIIQEGGQLGAMLGDLTTWELGPLMKIGGAGLGAGGRLLNATINAKRINQGIQVTTNSAKAGLYAANAEQAALTAQLWTREIQTASLLEREAIAAGNTAEAVSHAANKARYVESARLATEQAAKNAAKSQGFREVANALENSLPPAFQSQLAKAAMVSGAVPLKVTGAVVGKLGSTLAVVDRGISAVTGVFGLDKARGLLRAAGVFTGNINPLTIAEGVVASHKLWTGAGRLLNSLGENMLVNQGTAPFFRRVAGDMATPVGRTFATVADTFIPPIARGVGTIAKGVQTAAAPSLIFRAINEQGLDANVFKHAAADAIVFGAPLGFGAAVIGRKSDHSAARQADRADFNNKMKADPAQYEIYNSMVDPLTKDVVSSFVAAYPETQIKFVTEGPSFQQGNTATLNVNAPRDIIPVIALHELKHTLANQFQLNDLIKQKMVGDKTRPGDIFTKDGVLDPEFIAFGKEYNRRMKAGGMEELGIEDMAIEFYTDKAAEVLKSDIISGEFTGRAKESQLSRSIKAHFSKLVNQVPIIKNIHIKTGGAIDSSGKLVAGSGLVSGGLTQSPVVQAMVRKMYRETAGLTRQTKVPTGATISNTRIPQTKSTREGINNGTSAVENVNRQSREAGVEIPAGALDPSTPRGRDGVPTPLQTKAIIDSGAIHPEHLATFPTLVAEMVPDSSATFMFEYRPATQGRTAQSPTGETFHHVKPAGVRTNKKGNVLIIGIDINLWDKNIKKVANSKAAKDIGYSERAIREDAYEASKFHIKNQSPDPYFESKYGKEQALKRKSLVASTYGEMTKSQNNFNPLLAEASMSKADGVYRTFSLDDIKRVTRTNSTADLAFDPNNYYSLKINLMPEAPIVDRSGNIVENPIMKDFFENHLPSGQRFREKPMAPEAMDANAPKRYMPEQTRQMPENVSPEDLSPVANRIEAQRLFADGKRMFAVNEMDDFATEITSLDMLNSYPPDTIGYIDSADQSGARYMPEPLNPKTYENQKGYDTTELLKSKLDNEGKIILTKPTAPNEALTLLRDRRKVTKEIPIEARDKFLYDDLAKVTLYKNEGKDVSFNYDPNTQVKPVIKDAAIELSGKKVQIAMADRAMAALGDLGGILFPNLKVNQITFTGPDGIKYRPVWANMGWKPVLAMKVKAIQQGSVNLLTYIMGKDAHASNLRSVRTVSNEIANAGLQKHHEDLFITLANYGKMLENNATQVKTIQKHSNLISKLNEEITPENKVKTKKEILKKKDLIKKAKEKITKIPKEFDSLSSVMKAYRSASTGFENGTRSLANKNLRLADLEAYLKTPKFNKLASEYSGKQLIDVSNSFKGRKAALNATTGFEIEGFSTNKVIDEIGEFKGATNNQVLGAVELSSNPDLFAIYLGDNPKQIKFMSETEKAAAKYFKEHPDFVRHEAYDWVQLGPENGNNFLNSNPKKLVDYFKDFGDKYKKVTGKYPKTENAKVGAMRDGMSVVLEMPKKSK